MEGWGKNGTEGPVRITRRTFLVAIPLAGIGAWLFRERMFEDAAAASGAPRPIRVYSVREKGFIMSDTVEKTDAEWRKLLTPEEYEVTRRAGTEAAFSGAYWNTKEKGTYRCVCCGLDLYRSEAKYDSGTGWPSFRKPVADENIRERADDSLFARRTEVLCARCGAHLGHVFPDGPRPSGLRYCMNSAALVLAKDP